MRKKELEEHNKVGDGLTFKTVMVVFRKDGSM